MSTTVQQQILECTKATTFDNALAIIFSDYLRYKIYFLKNENIRFEAKWGMSFEEFEVNSTELPNGMSYEIEQEYYRWEAVITELEYFKSKLKEWK